MVTITIDHGDGRVYKYEEVVAFDFYDKEFCEDIAKRELTTKEANEISYRLDHVSDLNVDSVSETVRYFLEEQNAAHN